MKIYNSRIGITAPRVDEKGPRGILVLLELGDTVSCCLFENVLVRCNPGTPILFKECMILDSSIEEKRKGIPDDSSVIIEKTIFRECELPRAWYGECVLDGKDLGD